MTVIYLRYISLCTVFIGVAQTCPEPCVCVDKYAHQFADCAYKDLQVVPVGLPSNVTTLSLSANKIKTLLKNSFVNVTQVTSLWLAHNEIVTIEKGTLAVLVQLRNLDLSHNKVVHFPWGDLYNLTSLQLLKINNNNMVDLPRDAFSNLKDLRSLRINNNMFTTIVKGSFDSLSSMSHLQIYNNPFDCTCTLHWLKDWVANALISVPEPDLITCETPEDLKGIRIVQLPNLECVAPTVHIMSQPNLENNQINEGVMIIMHCNVTGSPKPEVKWKIRTGNQEIEFNMPITETKKNDLPLENSKQTANRFLMFKNGTLVIPRTSKREDGRYTCLATNEQGSVESSVNVVVAGTQKYTINAIQDAILDKTPTSAHDTGKMTFPTRATSGSFGTQRSGVVISSGQPAFGKKCGVSDSTQYISNHAFNQSSDELKQHTFDFGVIALEVSETEAKVQLNPFQAPTEKAHLEMLYLCINMGNGHSVVQWSKIEDGINAYRFQGLNPGTNYTLCLTYTGENCQVQVVFTTRKKIPSLMIIVVVSTFLLALATVPLLGATCCHLLYKYQGKTYKLIMKAHNPDQMEKHITTDFDPRASYVESEKNYNPTNQEEFEVGSEYSDRLPLGAEAVNISEEINGNYRQTAR
ncbi:ISLR2 protein, partial [Polyodon spathula]|nr:ISLR2 protein [Polyodon spathula]